MEKKKKTSKKKTKTAETEIVVVLDRSGSMSSILNATVDGFNTFLNEQKKAEGEGFLTLVQFDDRYELNYKSKPVKEVEELLANVSFIPRGSTALLDAIGKTINEVETDRDVVFVIITDGEENASKEFKLDVIKSTIEAKEKAGWKFVYLGANQDAITVGASLGIGMSNSISYNSNDASTRSAFMSTASNVSSYRNMKSMGKVDLNSLDFSADQRDDAKK